MWCTSLQKFMFIVCVYLLYRVTSHLAINVFNFAFLFFIYFKFVCFLFISRIYFLGTAFFDFFRFLPADPEQLLLLNNEMEFSPPPTLWRFCFSCNGCGCLGDANGCLIGCCLSITLAWPHELFTLPLKCDRLVVGDDDDVATPSAAEVAWVATCWTPFSIQPW